MCRSCARLRPMEHQCRRNELQGMPRRLSGQQLHLPGRRRELGDLHDVHREDMLNDDCDVCHLDSGRFPVLLDDSAGGTGFQSVGCVGCHGIDPGNGEPDWGAGLRLHHSNAGVRPDRNNQTCVDCHGTLPVPQPEDVLPVYYFTPDAAHPNKPTDPCNPAPDYPESFAAWSWERTMTETSSMTARIPIAAASCSRTVSNRETLRPGRVRHRNGRREPGVTRARVTRRRTRRRQPPAEHHEGDPECRASSHRLGCRRRWLANPAPGSGRDPASS